MTHRRHSFLRRGATRLGLPLASVGAVALTTALGGCDLNKTLAVKDVDVALPSSVSNAAGLDVLYAGARAELQVAIGYVDAAVTLPGLLTDELRDIDTFPTRIQVDQRNIDVTNGTVQGWYREMHLARTQLESAIAAFGKFDAKNVKVAELHALAGYVYVMFAEDFCNGVPYSKLDEGGNPVFGGPNTGMQSLDRAVAHFDSALAAAPAASSQRYLAQVGKGRALLDQGKFAAAAAAVQGVPLTFQYNINFSENSSRENNGVYVNTSTVSKRFAVADKDGGNGLGFRTEGMQYNTAANAVTKDGDPRVRWNQNGVGQDQVSPAYYTLKYPNRSAPIVLADGVEAQLIIAENQLQTGDNTGALATLNALRASAAVLGAVPYTQSGQSAGTLTPLTDAGSAAARVDQLFHERAFWMYLTGHRLGDMRRLVSQYGRSTESVFPTGTYTGAAGGTYQTDVNFPITNDEQNNPKAQSCTDRKAAFQ